MDDISVRFGGVSALTDVSLSLVRGETLGVIGPNGAGKTSLINVITGFVRPSAGRIHLDGRDISSTTPWQRARHGIARTYQSQRIFVGLTVRENLEVVRPHQHVRGWVDRLLELSGLGERAFALAGSLSHGDRCLLGVARALASTPSFLLLDEPVAGLDPLDISRLGRVLALLQEEHRVGVLLIDHNMEFVFRSCPRILVLDRGRVLAVGDRHHLERNEEVMRAYVGSKDGHGGD